MTDADHEELAESLERPTHPSLPVGLPGEMTWDRSGHAYVNGERACCTGGWGKVWHLATGGHR